MKDTGKTSIMEILFIVSMFIPTILMGVLGMWPLFWVFLLFSVCFGLVELIYVRKTGRTVSQHFWEFSRNNRKKAFIILGAMALFWIALLWHLGYKMFM